MLQNEMVHLPTMSKKVCAKTTLKPFQTGPQIEKYWVQTCKEFVGLTKSSSHKSILTELETNSVKYVFSLFLMIMFLLFYLGHSHH
jgi:hypothetical protein